MKSKILKATGILFLICITFLSWLYYATTAKANHAKYSIGFSNESITVHDLANGVRDQRLARMDEYAELSEIAYRDSTEGIYTYSNWNYFEIDEVDLSPSTEDRIMFEELHYELWELEEDDEIIVAIVFRGTANFKDWIANLRWFRRVFDGTTWDHYDQLKKVSEDIISLIKARYPEDENLTIVSAGHSLGGGLAQFMAYLTPEVAQVYAFDPSPVTGFYDVAAEKRKNNKKGKVIYRIYESGEILSFTRNFMTFLYPAPLFLTEDPKIVRIRLSFSTGKNSVGQHSMKELAKHLKGYKDDPNYVVEMKKE